MQYGEDIYICDGISVFVEVGVRYVSGGGWDGRGWERVVEAWKRDGHIKTK